MKNFLLKTADIKTLTTLKGSCIASNKITIDGCKVGYCYREKPTTSSDSGWRFFEGTEDENYCNNSDNFNIFELNTICNYDESILGVLNSPIESSFIKENGKFVEDTQKTNH